MVAESARRIDTPATNYVNLAYVNREVSNSEGAMAEPEPIEESLYRLYQKALAASGLPHRSPSHRMAEQLAAAAEAMAFAKALALVTGDEKWEGNAMRVAEMLRGRILMDQRDIDAGDRAENKVRRYPYHYP